MTESFAGSSTRRTGVRRRWRLLSLMGACCCLTGILNAVEPARRLTTVEVDRFIARYWSQNRPNLNYGYGCETGWHSFGFRADGYFIYDGKISGAWWIDHLNNIEVRTNSGERMELFYDGVATLTQRERTAEAPSSVFGTEFRTYSECETDKVRLH